MNINHNVLLISSSIKGKFAVMDMLQDLGGYYQIKTVASGSEARQALMSMTYDLVVINHPLIDETGELLAVDIAQSTISGVILIVKNDIVEEVNSHVENYGILTIAKPLSKSMFCQLVKVAIVNNNRWLRFEKENEKIKAKYEELRLVSKAKCYLIQYKGLTEEKAHRYIEKDAMDKRISKSEISLRIINKWKSEEKDE